MLEANKNRLLERVFAVYNRNLLRRRFHSFRVSGLNFLLNKIPHKPLIIYLNHSSWWDGLVAFQISYRARLHSYVMMEEKQLENLSFFRRLGAFSVVRENPRAAMQSINYIAGILKTDPKTALWIFPQGEILPNDRRPLKFYGGLAKIIEKTGVCTVASLSVRYEFLGEFKPEIFVKINKPENISVDSDFDARRMTALLSGQLTENLDALKNDVNARDLANYHSIF